MRERAHELKAISQAIRPDHHKSYAATQDDDWPSPARPHPAPGSHAAGTNVPVLENSSDPEATLADWLERCQALEQARFAALPHYFKSNNHVLLLHQLRLMANQAAYDSARETLKRPECRRSGSGI